MSKVTGILDKAYQGKGGFWSIKIVGDETWYGTYKDDYTKYEGQEVEFEATQRGKYWNAKDVKPVPGAKRAAPAQAGGGSYNAEERQQSIVLQSSFKTAGDIVGALIAADKVSLGTKKSDHFDMAMGLLEEAALRIYHRCIAPADFIGGEEEPAPGPDGDDWDIED